MSNNSVAATRMIGSAPSAEAAIAQVAVPPKRLRSSSAVKFADFRFRSFATKSDHAVRIDQDACIPQGHRTIAKTLGVPATPFRSRRNGQTETKERGTSKLR